MSVFDDITDAHNGRKITFTTMSSEVDERTHLRQLEERFRTDAPPVVLWNVIPSRFSVLHAIYAQKLADLAGIGFNCVVLIFDSYVSDYKELGAGERRNLQAHADLLKAQILATGVDSGKIEFVHESALRQSIGAETEFTSGITLLARLLQDNAGASSPHRNALNTFGALLELYYETEIDADVVLASEADADGTWNNVRHTRSRTARFGRYTPPLIGEFEMFTAVDGTYMRADLADNVASINDSADKIRAMFDTADFRFAATVHSNLRSPLERDVPHTFEEVVQGKNEDDCRRDLAEFTIDYLQGIKNRSRA